MRQPEPYLTAFADGYYTVSKTGDKLYFNILRFGQIQGWQQNEAPFVLSYPLQNKGGENMIIQKGRLTGWNAKTIKAIYGKDRRQMNWYILIGAGYFALVIFVCLRILYDIQSTSKAFAYLLVTLLLPGIGIFIYFAVGANYRKNKLYSKKIIHDYKLMAEIRRKIVLESEKTWETGEQEVKTHKELARLLLHDNSPLTGNNEVKLLLNGEEKFPEVIKALEAAQHHIHIEYYIFENNGIGNQIKEILLQKAAAGVQVRFIYDDFGSRGIRKGFVQELRDGGVEAFPFYKIWLIALSNRTNYRDHRKIIVVDGCTGFVGGINVSDQYINPTKPYWRDTHVMINGPGVYYLQYLFICDWNFCCGKNLPVISEYFCSAKTKGKAIVQIAASGPDSDTPTIMYSLFADHLPGKRGTAHYLTLFYPW